MRIDSIGADFNLPPGVAGMVAASIAVPIAMQAFKKYFSKQKGTPYFFKTPDKMKCMSNFFSGLSPVDSVYDSRGRLITITQGSRVSAYAYNQF